MPVILLQSVNNIFKHLKCILTLVYHMQCLKWTVAQSPNATNILFGRPKLLQIR